MDAHARTIIERFGFKDNDHRKSRHDEIQIWVYQNFHLLLKVAYPEQIIDPKIPADVKLEYAIAEGKFVIGFVDVYSTRFNLAVEVKTEIPLVGELLRQLQFYRQYLSGPRWIVVSPDDRCAGILKDHGIFFFKYASNQLDLF